MILEGARTPVGRFLGSFAETPVVELGAIAAREAMRRANVDPQDVDQTIVGHARQAGNGPNTGRQASVRAGVPEEVAAYNVRTLAALVRDGFAILKVGPGLTFALREALYGLDHIAAALDGNPPELEAAMDWETDSELEQELELVTVRAKVTVMVRAKVTVMVRARE